MENNQTCCIAQTNNNRHLLKDIMLKCLSIPCSRLSGGGGREKEKKNHTNGELIHILE